VFYNIPLYLSSRGSWEERVRRRREIMRASHVVFGLSLGTSISCTFLFFPFIGEGAIFPLIMFNFFFVSLTFPLDGTLQRKICMLLIGNIIGLLWNHIFSLFANAACSYFGEFCNALFIIMNPFLNLFWLVSFWSMSLTLLTTPKIRRRTES